MTVGRSLSISRSRRGGRPAPPGLTGRFEFVDVPSHVEDLERYRDRGFRMVTNQIAIVTDHPGDLIEVHPRRGEWWSSAG